MVAIGLSPGLNALEPNCRSSPYLAYHEITKAEPAYLYGTSAGQFREHLRCVQRLAALKHSRSSVLRITLDDGHASQYECAFPVLQELSMKATFFITAGWTDKYPEYMTWKQLGELSRAGHEVQSHGWSHTHLTRCSDHALSAELRGSKFALEDHLGMEVTAISAPGGRWNQRVVHACEDAGYKRLFISDPWINKKRAGGIAVLGRWMVTRNMDENKIASLLDVRGTSMTLLRARNLLKLTARIMIGDSAYQALWRRVAEKTQSPGGHYFKGEKGT